MVTHFPNFTLTYKLDCPDLTFDPYNKKSLTLTLSSFFVLFFRLVN